ncbi:MAG: ABC-F family ATP-binding cassette domain-containing protein [Bdellovibrionales bacterium]|nr:ABC-F family ATP-binding cassette domain-containing protein [Bdellovibrionales bacterium]
MIHLTGISKQYGTRVLYSDSSFQVRDGDKIGLVGPNGAGKSTIFRIIVGEEGIDSGEVNIAERAVIGYFSQDVAEMKGRTALEEVMAGAGKVSELAKEMAKLEAKLQEPLDEDEMMKVVERYGEVQSEFESRSGYDLESRAQAILTGLGIGPEDYNRMVDTFSGGWKMRIALAKILALNPDVLLVDEPTNHLDLESILWLEEWFQNFKGAIVMTSHDREFMNRIVKRIVEVANKTITTYSGNYDFYLREREIRKEQLLAAHQKQQDMLAKEEEFIARFAARASHAAQVQSRVKKLEKIDRIEIPAEDRVMAFDFAPPPRSGNDVVRFQGLGKIYKKEDGKEKSVFSGLEGWIQRLDKVAVVGVNGAGKSTLLKIMAGQVDPTTGTCTIGASVKIGYFSQSSLDVLNPNKTIFQEIYDRIPEATIGFVRNLLGAFLFTGDDVEKKIGVLSGGEKTRVVIATLLATPVNFLILDEPTNHLDIKSREVLLDAIKKFDGTVALVSHDRHFLREVATRVFEVDHGQLRAYEGDFEYYIDSSPLAKATNGRLKVAR